MKIKTFIIMLLLAATAFAQKEDTQRRPDQISRDSFAAIPGSISTIRAPLFTEDFEALSLGDINGQGGWFGQFGNWEVEETNPFAGSQHMYSISDGLGQTLAISATITPGATGTHVASAQLSMNNNSGVSWEFIPQSAGEGLVATRIVFDGAGGIWALSNTNGGEYLDTGATAPAGYFQLAVVLDEAAAEFTLYIDGDAVFTAPSFGTAIDNIAFLSQMEVSGPVFLADDVSISDSFAPPVTIPTLGEWGLIAFLIGMAGLGLIFVRKSRAIA